MCFQDGLGIQGICSPNNWTEPFWLFNLFRDNFKKVVAGCWWCHADVVFSLTSRFPPRETSWSVSCPWNTCAWRRTLRPSASTNTWVPRPRLHPKAPTRRRSDGPPGLPSALQERNEPANVALSCSYIAKVKGQPPETVRLVTTQNAYRLFSRASRWCSEREYCSITHSDSYFCHSAPRWQHAGTDLPFPFHRAADNHIRRPNHFQDPLLDSDVSLTVRHGQDGHGTHTATVLSQRSL